jgi:hypothetical protein
MMRACLRPRPRCTRGTVVAPRTCPNVLIVYIVPRTGLAQTCKRTETQYILR